MGEARRFVVVVRAGEASLHRKWLEGANRSWDLVVSWYGDAAYERVADETVMRIKGGKGDGLAATFAAFPELLTRYEYFWLPDDDIEADSETICTLFDIASTEGLAVCQPALTHDSFFSYVHTLQSRSFHLRYASFVEIMVPCLSREHLLRVLPYFERNPSAFGLDWIWTRLDPDNRKRAAVVDAIAVCHTRPIGVFLHERMRRRGEDPATREREILAAFGITQPDAGFPCYGGRLRDSGRPSGPWATRLLMAKDYFAHIPSWKVKRPWKRAWRLFRKPRASLEQLIPIGRPAQED